VARSDTRDNKEGDVPRISEQSEASLRELKVTEVQRDTWPASR
jgi:hypothetical protein